MSLFVINRYDGEKEETKNEKNHLSELLQRIEQRKLERAVESNLQNIQKVKHEERNKKKKKKKKKKIDEDTPNVDVISKNVYISDQDHKRKRIQNKDVYKEENDIQYETATLKDEKLQGEATSDRENQISSNKSIDSSEQLKDKIKQQTNFIVLGTKAKGKKHQVKRVLPEWLANPNIISINLDSGPSLKELDTIVDSNLIRVLKANGINKLFPVQASMMSWILKCNKDRQEGWWLRDTCVSAPTGSGKTLAYVLPIVQTLQSRLVPKIRCLVVVPVKELAAQVCRVIVTYTLHTSLKVALLSGASTFHQEQNNILKKSARGEYIPLVDIAIATPGRLIDHILKTPGFSLNDLRFLVIDEADKAADWLEYLPEPHYQTPRLTLFNIRNSKIPAQKLLFSATLSQDPEKLNRLGLFQPILFTSVLVTDKDDDVNLDVEASGFIGRYTSPKELIEQAVECTAEHKPMALYQLLNRNNTALKTLVFTNSGKTAHRLAILLRSLLSSKDIAVGELSAQFSPKERENILKKFITGAIQILVSSDALARGVDIPDVQLVISYDCPKYVKGYIHRAGRTGRAGKSGIAVSILTSKQVEIFKHMLNNAHKAVPNIEKLELNSLANETNYSSHIEKLRNDLEAEKQNSLARTKAVKRIYSVVM